MVVGLEHSTRPHVSNAIVLAGALNRVCSCLDLCGSPALAPATIRDGSSTLVLVLKSALSTFFEVLDGAFKLLTKLSTCACT